AHDLVAPLRRQNEVGVSLVMGKQPVLIGRKPEKVGLLLRPLDRSPLRAATYAILPDGRLAFGVIGLVAHRVPAGILAEIDIARLFHPPPDLGRRAVMALLGGADEITVGKSQHL